MKVAKVLYKQVLLSKFFGKFLIKCLTKGKIPGFCFVNENNLSNALFKVQSAFLIGNYSNTVRAQYNLLKNPTI